jgi:ABC-type sugar transport system permease subunit
MKARRRIIIPFLLPSLLLIFIFFIMPAIQTIILSFQNWDGTFQTSVWVGFENYRKIFKDPTFVKAIWHTFYYFIISTVILFPVALFLAVSFSRLKRGRMTIQFLIFMPVTMSVTVAAVLWKWYVYDPNMGLWNNILRLFGMGRFSQAWLGNSKTAMTCIILMSIWHGVSTWVIMIVAAMDRIPVTLSESARLDGANEFQLFKYITFPLLWEVVSTLLILEFIGCMQQFPVVYAMTQGGPYGSTELMATYIYKMAFEGRKFSYGSAMAIVMAMIILVISMVGNKFLKTEPIEY